MPQKRSRARDFGGRGINVDLGALFGAIGEGGVEANPDFGKPPGQVDFRYKGDPSQLVKQPVRAKNIFAKPYAAQANQEYILKNALAEAARKGDLQSLLKRIPIDVKAKRALGDVELEQYKGKIPAEVERATKLGEVESRQSIIKEKELSKLKESEGWKAAQRAYLLANNLAPTPENFASADRALTEAHLATLTAEEAAAGEKSRRNVAEEQLTSKIGKETAETRFKTALEKAGGELEEIKGERSLIGPKITSKRQQFEQEPRLRESEIVRNRFFPLTAPLFDIGANKIVAKPQTFMDFLGEKIDTGQETPTTPTKPKIGNTVDATSDPQFILIKDPNGNIIQRIPKNSL